MISFSNNSGKVLIFLHSPCFFGFKWLWFGKKLKNIWVEFDDEMGFLLLLLLLLLILGMGTKTVLIPADEIDLSAVKYEYEQIDG